MKVWWTLGEVWYGSWDPSEVRDRLVDPRGSPGLVGGLSGRCRTGRGTFGEVQDGSGNPPKGPGRVRGTSERFGKGWGTLGEVKDE